MMGWVGEATGCRRERLVHMCVVLGNYIYCVCVGEGEVCIPYILYIHRK